MHDHPFRLNFLELIKIDKLQTLWMKLENFNKFSVIKLYKITFKIHNLKCTSIADLCIAITSNNHINKVIF